MPIPTEQVYEFELPIEDTLQDNFLVRILNADGVSAMVLAAAFAHRVHNHVEADITDLDKYTQSEVDGFINNLQGQIDGNIERLNLLDSRITTIDNDLQEYILYGSTREKEAFYETDPSTLGDPESGEVYMGVWGGHTWVKTSNGGIYYGETTFRGYANPSDTVPANIQNGDWVRCKGADGSTYTNFGGVVADNGNRLEYSSESGQWLVYDDSGSGDITLTSDMDANSKKIINLDDGINPKDAANISQLGNVEAIKVNKNLFDKSKGTDGFLINNNGTITASSSYGYTDYIPVESGETYTGWNGIYGMRKTCFYDSDKNVVAGGSADNITTFTVPAGVLYVRVTYYVSGKDTFQFEKGATATAYEDFGYHLSPSSIPNDTIRPTEIQDISGVGLSRDANGLLNVGFDDKTIEENDGKLRVKDNSIKSQKINPFAAIEGTKTAFLKTKNLFYKPDGTDGYYIENNGTIVVSSSYGYTDYIPVESGETYTGWDGSYGMRKTCYYDSDKIVVTGGSTNNITTFTVPAGVAYVRVTYYISKKDTFQFEKGATATVYEDYKLKFETEGKDSVEVIPTKTINIANSDKIIFFGDSYTEQFNTLKGKSYISYLSMFSDWNFENYSISGNDYPDILARIQNDTASYKSGYGISKYNGNYAFLISYTNDDITSQAAFQQYISDLKEVIRAVKGLGMTPVICTEYHNNGSYGDLLETSLSKVADEYGCLFVDILPKTKNLFTTRYPNFWYTSHPGIRANTLFWDNIKPFIESLPRPRQGIKIFRKRNSFTISSNADLLYKDNYERAKAFKELFVSQKTFTDDQAKYFDDLTTLEGIGATNQTVAEYFDLRNGDTVNFNDYALVEVITPTTAKYIDSLHLHISDATVSVYVKDNVNNNWVEITNNNGICELPQFMNYFDADKVSFLLYKSGGFSLTDCYVKWSGTESKDYKLETKRLTPELSTPELLTNTKVDDLTGWTVTGTLTPADPYDSIFPVGITKMVELTTANYLSQSVSFAAEPLRVRKAQVKIWVRYLPPVFDSSGNYPDDSWTDEDKYDLAEINIQLQKDANNIVVKNHYVALHWHEIKFDVDIPINETGFDLVLKSNDAKTIQFAFASVKIEE